MADGKSGASVVGPPAGGLRRLNSATRPSLPRRARASCKRKVPRGSGSSRKAAFFMALTSSSLVARISSSKCIRFHLQLFEFFEGLAGVNGAAGKGHAFGDGTREAVDVDGRAGVEEDDVALGAGFAAEDGQNGGRAFVDGVDLQVGKCSGLEAELRGPQEEFLGGLALDFDAEVFAERGELVEAGSAGGRALGAVDDEAVCEAQALQGFREHARVLRGIGANEPRGSVGWVGKGPQEVEERAEAQLPPHACYISQGGVESGRKQETGSGFFQ